MCKECGEYNCWCDVMCKTCHRTLYVCSSESDDGSCPLEFLKNTDVKCKSQEEFEKLLKLKLFW